MGVVLRLDINREKIIALGSTPGQPLHRWMTVTLAQIDARAKSYLSGEMVKVRTGNLRSSQFSRIEMVGETLTGVLENVASYAAAVHDGTQPHEIRARNVKVLTGWSFRGSPVFTPVVHHPGTTGRPFLRQAMTDVIQGGFGLISVPGAM